MQSFHKQSITLKFFKKSFILCKKFINVKKTYFVITCSGFKKKKPYYILIYHYKYLLYKRRLKILTETHSFSNQNVDAYIGHIKKRTVHWHSGKEEESFVWNIQRNRLFKVYILQITLEKTHLHASYSKYSQIYFHRKSWHRRLYH